MDDTNVIGVFTKVVAEFNDKYGTMFAQDGVDMYRALALIMIVWVGTQIALSGQFQMDKLMKFIFLIGLGFAFTSNYANGEWSIPKIMEEQTDHVVKAINSDACKEMETKSREMWEKVPYGSWKHGIVSSWVTYWVLTFLYIVLNMCAFFVIVYGLIAQNVIVMLGPFFIPWLIVPKMDWLFWGWLKALFHFSFYRVVAAAVTSICSSAFVRLIDTAISPAQTGADVYQLALAPLQVAIICMYILVAVMTILKIPALAASLFSGGGGGDGGVAGLVTAACKTAATAAV
jgi:hypothetical protein